MPRLAILAALLLSVALTLACQRTHEPRLAGPEAPSQQNHAQRERPKAPQRQPRAQAPTPAPAAKGTPADALEARARQLRRELDDSFTVLVEPPFVVIGDEAPQQVARRASGTVRWAVRQLKRSYFRRDPLHPIDIWLFRNERSYRHHTAQRFGETPDTPYGYYSPSHRALVMNIATGGGTLVHEIVHPFVEANFPGCPAWFNEGLGSLYEQSASRDGRIVGLTNWRLEGLQKAIRRSALPSFERLTHTSSDEFYNRDPGTHYAQARYLLYDLQERGLLERYYHAFVRNQGSDPSGYATLRAVLGNKDMRSFQRQWEQRVLALRFE
jgi:hypothetical protein